jgi:hypothetical protein
MSKVSKESAEPVVRWGGYASAADMDMALLSVSRETRAAWVAGTARGGALAPMVSVE